MASDLAKTLVELHQPARVRGNIETPSLMVEKGVMFDGQCKMEGGGPRAATPLTTPVPTGLP